MLTLTPQHWLQLKPTTREALIKIFHIPKSGYTHVVNNGQVGRVDSDGHTYEDLQAISLEEMKKLTQLESDNFFEQFELIVKMVEADGSEAAEYPQPGNATQDVTTKGTGTSESSNQPEAGINRGTEEGSKPEEKNSQDPVLPVSGGEQQVNRGRDELLSDTVSNNQPGMEPKDAKVDTQEPQVERPNRQVASGRKTNKVGA